MSVELTALRTLNTKTFREADGSRTLRARVNPQHYVDDSGDLQDVDLTVPADGHVAKCAYDVTCYTDKVGYAGTDPGGKRIELEVKGVAWSEPKRDGNAITWSNVAKDTDLRIEFLAGAIRVLRVLKTDQAPKSATFRSLREAGAMGSVINKGVDGVKRATKLTIETALTGTAGECEIQQTFDGQVRVVDDKTRVASWSADVAYPVTIDPTSTFTIAANADDGIGYATGTTTGVFTASLRGQLENYGALRKDAYLRFDNITIGQGATVSAATLKLYNISILGSASVGVKADGHGDPAVPISAAQVFTPTTTAGALATAFTNSVTVGKISSKSAYTLKSINVQTMVQALVNSFAYSSEAMMFFFRTIGSTTAFVYQRDWGTSKDAELVINFTPPDNSSSSTVGESTSDTSVSSSSQSSSSTVGESTSSTSVSSSSQSSSSQSSSSQSSSSQSSSSSAGAAMADANMTGRRGQPHRIEAAIGGILWIN